MQIVAKMEVVSLHQRFGGTTVEFACRYDQNTPEDQRFQKATPSGSITMQVDNPVALEQFKLGKTFYVRFDEVPKP